MIKIIALIKKWFFTLSAWLTPQFVPVYRLVDILESKDKEHDLIIQVVHKNITFKIKPETLLADDALVDLFSPRDVRTLTYLGYLDKNSPKYKIVAKRFKDNSQMAFALRRKTDKKVIIKTTSEIMQEKMITGFDAHDAQLLGYTAATESIVLEKMQKAFLKQET